MENMEMENYVNNEEIDNTNQENEDENGLGTAAKAGIIGGVVAAGVGAFFGVRAGIRKVKKTLQYAKKYAEEHPELEEKPAKKVKPAKKADLPKALKKKPDPEVIDVDPVPVPDEEPDEE